MINECIQILVPVQKQIDLVTKLQRVARLLEDLKEGPNNRDHDARSIQAFLLEAEVKERDAETATDMSDDANFASDPANLVGPVELLVRFLHDDKNRWDSILMDSYAISQNDPHTARPTQNLSNDIDDSTTSVTQKSGATIAQELVVELEKQNTGPAETTAYEEKSALAIQNTLRRKEAKKIASEKRIAQQEEKSAIVIQSVVRGKNAKKIVNVEASGLGAEKSATENNPNGSDEEKSALAIQNAVRRKEAKKIANEKRIAQQVEKSAFEGKGKVNVINASAVDLNVSGTTS
jgi:hypothetical protein